MNVPTEAITVPLFDDGRGGLRITGTRVVLERIVHAFEDGPTPEGIAQSYGSGPHQAGPGRHVPGRAGRINVFTPGGLGSAQTFAGVNFADTVIHDLQRKRLCKQYYGQSITNVEVATM
jgi:hypothetical protein